MPCYSLPTNLHKLLVLWELGDVHRADVQKPVITVAGGTPAIPLCWGAPTRALVIGGPAALWKGNTTPSGRVQELCEVTLNTRQAETPQRSQAVYSTVLQAISRSAPKYLRLFTSPFNEPATNVCALQGSKYLFEWIIITVTWSCFGVTLIWAPPQAAAPSSQHRTPEVYPAIHKRSRFPFLFHSIKLRSTWTPVQGICGTCTCVWWKNLYRRDLHD